MEYTIYKITLINNSEFVYVGSTKNYKSRKNEHKTRCNNETNNSKVYTIIRNNGGWPNVEFKPVEILICKSRTEALIREEFWRIHFKANMNSMRCYAEGGKSLKNYERDIYQCNCGGRYTKKWLLEHNDCDKHKFYLNTINDGNE
jgi:hypothetical protein